MFNQCKTTVIPTFYQEIHNNWSDLQCIEIEEHSVILNQVIWNNRYLTIDRKPFMWKKWFDNGIVYIQDLVNDNGKLYSQIEMNNKYNISSNFLNALQLRQCIPINWRSIIQNQHVKRMKEDERNKPFFFTHNKKYLLENTPTNILYWTLIGKKKRSPTCIKRWTENYPNLITAEDEIWQNIFVRSFQISRDTTLQSFQYRLIHRILPCNEKLYE